MDGKDDIDLPEIPSDRLRRLAEHGSTLDVDYKTPALMYFRSGIQMVRMAEMYLKQGSIRDAYLLFVRFLTVFLEKIPKHPGWATLSIQDRKIMSDKVKEIMPKTEKLKQILLQQYEEEYQFNMRVIEEKRKLGKDAGEEEREPERFGTQQQQQGRPAETSPHLGYSGSNIEIGPMVPLDSIVYPDALKGQTIQPSAPTLKPVTNDDSSASKSNNLKHSMSLTVDRSKKPASLLSLSAQSHHGLRNVVIPTQLVEKFLVLSHPNSIRNVETCGILAGHVDQNQLVISHLIVPKQRGSADSCITENEEEVFYYQDKFNLITLGWIHTHPSQTAFLSSVDLHSHCSYQLMMPEAIAIVCAVQHKDNSIFCLTQNYGLDFIAKCSLSGFHPHPMEPPLFTVAEHARLESDLPVDVVDLRS